MSLAAGQIISGVLKRGWQWQFDDFPSHVS